jgi:hypothetical protein
VTAAFEADDELDFALLDSVDERSTAAADGEVPAARGSLTGRIERL